MEESISVMLHVPSYNQRVCRTACIIDGKDQYILQTPIPYPLLLQWSDIKKDVTDEYKNVPPTMPRHLFNTREIQGVSLCLQICCVWLSTHANTKTSYWIYRISPGGNREGFYAEYLGRHLIALPESSCRLGVTATSPRESDLQTVDFGFWRFFNESRQCSVCYERSRYIGAAFATSYPDTFGAEIVPWCALKTTDVLSQHLLCAACAIDEESPLIYLDDFPKGAFQSLFVDHRFRGAGFYAIRQKVGDGSNTKSARNTPQENI